MYCKNEEEDSCVLLLSSTYCASSVEATTDWKVTTTESLPSSSEMLFSLDIYDNGNTNKCKSNYQNENLYENDICDFIFLNENNEPIVNLDDARQLVRHRKRTILDHFQAAKNIQHSQSG